MKDVWIRSNESDEQTLQFINVPPYQSHQAKGYQSPIICSRSPRNPYRKIIKLYSLKLYFGYRLIPQLRKDFTLSPALLLVHSQLSAFLRE